MKETAVLKLNDMFKVTKLQIGVQNTSLPIAKAHSSSSPLQPSWEVVFRIISTLQMMKVHHRVCYVILWYKFPQSKIIGI